MFQASVWIYKSELIFYLTLGIPSGEICWIFFMNQLSKYNLFSWNIYNLATGYQEVGVIDLW